MYFCGKVLRDGQVVLDPAEGDLYETIGATGTTDWHGRLLLPPGPVLPPCPVLAHHVVYRLALDDGRAGNFLVEGNLTQGGQATRVTFRGVGALR